MLREYQIIPSMSRPAHPRDNASCESFLKTLKREEIYANDYRDMEHLAQRIGQLYRSVLQPDRVSLGLPGKEGEDLIPHLEKCLPR